MNVKVTKLTEKYIRYEYAHFYRSGTFYVPSSDELMQQFYFRSASATLPKKLTDTAQIAVIDFNVNASLHKNVNFDTIGLRLHKFVKNEMCHEIERLSQNEKNIKKNIENWLILRGIEDEDFSVEAAVKMFFRFRKRKFLKDQKNMSKSVRLQKKIVLQKGHFLTEKKVDSKATSMTIDTANYVAANAHYFSSSRGNGYKRLLKAATCYIKRKCNNLTPIKIAQEENLSERAVRRNVRRFSLFLKSKPNLPHP